MSTPCAGCNAALATHEVTLSVREGFGFPSISHYQISYALCPACGHGLCTATTPAAVRRQSPAPFRHRRGPNGQGASTQAAPAVAAAVPATATATTSAVVEKKKK